MAEIIPFYDKWKLASGRDDEVVVHHCEHCDGEIYKGEEFLMTSEGAVHEDCFDEFAHELLETRHEIAGE
jgi:hypothetical protein